MSIVLVAKATPVVIANLQGIVYYCQTYGIKEGLDMYSCMGLKGIPEGLISVIQMDLADGDSDISKAIQYADDVVYAKKDYWAEPGVKRGKEIDEFLGNNLGENFPIIDVYNAKERTITSIKSIDLTLKSYQTRNGLYNRLAKYVRQLAGFRGKRWNNRDIRINDYDIKTLRIAIPDVTITSEQKLVFDAVKLYAKEQGIKVIVTVVK